jgi:ATP-binding cassette subfamily A (ABC1) protein 3
VGGKLAASLLAPTAFTFVADLAGTAEGAGAGLRWADLWAGAFPPGAALCMLLADAALYAVLAWCDNPNPILEHSAGYSTRMFIRI